MPTYLVTNPSCLKQNQRRPQEPKRHTPQKSNKKTFSVPLRVACTCSLAKPGKTRGFGNRYIMAILGRKYRNIMAKYRKYGISIAIAYGRYPTR